MKRQHFLRVVCCFYFNLRRCRLRGWVRQACPHSPVRDGLGRGPPHGDLAALGRVRAFRRVALDLARQPEVGHFAHKGLVD